MIVAASTACFPQLSLPSVLERLTDLEYTSVEISLHEESQQIRPSQLIGEFDRMLNLCRQTRLSIVAFSADIRATGETYYEQFHACCKLAKQTKVVTMVVPPAELGTPFNEEIERLRRLVAIATVEGVLVALRTVTGCLTENPDTAMSLCDNVKGLGICFDPSHFIYGPFRGNKSTNLLKHTLHVHLRDTSKEQLQVRVGQGEVEYGRLITLLGKLNYRRAFSVYITEMEGVDHAGELRKMRLLLESLL